MKIAQSIYKPRRGFLLSGKAVAKAAKNTDAAQVDIFIYFHSAILPPTAKYSIPSLRESVAEMARVWYLRGSYRVHVLSVLHTAWRLRE